MPSVHDAYKKQSANMHNQQFRKGKPDSQQLGDFQLKKLNYPRNVCMFCMFTDVLYNCNTLCYAGVVYCYGKH